MDQMNVNVSSMQVQFIALMEKLEVMNSRVGILEVRPSSTGQGTPAVSPVVGLTKRDDSVSEKSKLPSSTHPPEAKGGEKPA